MDMNNYMERSTALVEALPYIQKYYGKTVVIKYGGNAMVSDELRSAVISDIILLNLVGVRVVMVHGGGPEIADMLKKIGKQSHFVDGLRYTDEETMDIVQQVLCGKVNKNLVSIINNLGGRAIGLCGLDGALFQAKKLDEKYGLVGKIVKVCPQVVNDCLADGYIPVISTVALGIDNDTSYNINADTAAAELAIALGAQGAMLEDCITYGMVLLPAIPAYVLQYEFQCLFVTAEKPNLGLAVTVASGLTNMVLDALFVAVLPFGLQGAAAATALSQCVGGILPLIYFARPNSGRLRLGKTRWDGRALIKASPTAPRS